MSDFLSAQPGEPDTSHLASNNPFRNRAVSPSLPVSPTSPFADPPTSGRPGSRNPFLDPANDKPAPPSSGRLIDVNMSSNKTDGNDSSLIDIFNSIDIDDKKSPNNSAVGAARSQSPYGSGPANRGRPGDGRPPRVKNIPPPRPSSPSSHRPSRSQEEAMKSRQRSTGRMPNGEPGSGSRDGPNGRRPPRQSRPRRNSESSVAGEKSIKERTLREHRHRDHSTRERGGSRPSRRNDIIDQMDATSIFGTVFHHDGPFDALNPHRNRRGSRRAPMQAFPKDSLNNVLGGSGPLNSRPDHKTFMGEGDDEAFKEFSSNSRPDKMGSSSIPVFDPTQRSSIMHGDETLGLGTSTFLEGTPAARTTIQRQDAERAQDFNENSLQRKKSLAQRFRSINRGPREPRAYSTDPVRNDSGRSAFDEFDTQKGDDVITVRRKGSNAPTSPSSPPHGLTLERRSTTDSAGPTGNSFPTYTPPPAPADDAQQRSASGSGTGLLARVKSLKGGRRAAPPPPLKDS